MEYPRTPEMHEIPRFTEHLDYSPPFLHDESGFPEQSPQYDGRRNHESHQSLSKEPSLSPELGSPGLQSVWDDEGAKEVAYPQVQHEYYRGQHGLVPGLPGYGYQGSYSTRECCGMSKRAFFILIAIIIIVLSTGLGVGLGLGLSEKHSSSPAAPTSSSTPNSEYLIGGAISPAYYSTTGAFNGSGIALASQSFASKLEDSTEGSIVMYFQHHTGQIRWLQLSTTGDWLGGTFAETIAMDAKNSTPLSAVSYSIGGVNTWHVFYIDTNNYIRQITNSNTTNLWADGPINQLNLKANDADEVGMQACWYGSDYGDSDYKHTPLPTSGEDGNSSFSNQVGMHIWYASDDTTFQQLGWRDGDATWEPQGSFSNLNGHAGVGCYSWGPGTVTYAMFVNTENAVEVYWRDTNTNLTNTTSHPINIWVKAPVSIPNVDPSTSLGYTNYFYAQMAETHMMNGYNISWAAENTSIVANTDFTVEGEPGLPGTHLSVSAIPNDGGGNSVIVFYQTEGNDITEYTRDLVAGQWTSADLPIPPQ